MVDRAYKFDEFQLDPDRRRLVREQNELKLSDNEFDLLIYLIENRPNICSHEEIVRDVWRDSFVTTNSVEKAVVSLRKAIRDDAKSPRYIKNRRGQGYVFIGDVVESDVDQPNVGVNGPAQVALGNERALPHDGGIKRWAVASGIAAVGILILCISWLYGHNVLERFNSTVLFADDFSSDVLDPNRWESFGRTVAVEGGKLILSVDETDRPGIVYSPFFSIDPRKKLTIESRLKVSFSRNMKNETYFGGVFGFIQRSDSPDNMTARKNTDAENRHFTGLRYMNYDSKLTFSGYSGERLQEVPTEGFFIVKDGGRPSAKEEYQAGKISERIEPIWETWFEQKIEYDPETGQFDYFIDGHNKAGFIVGQLKAKDDQIRLLILPWGWWVNHSMEIDYIRVRQ